MHIIKFNNFKWQRKKLTHCDASCCRSIKHTYRTFYAMYVIVLFLLLSLSLSVFVYFCLCLYFCLYFEFLCLLLCKPAIWRIRYFGSLSDERTTMPVYYLLHANKQVRQCAAICPSPLKEENYTCNSKYTSKYNYNNKCNSNI